MRLALSIVALVLALSDCLQAAAPVAVRRSQQFTVFDARPIAGRSPGQLRTPSGQPLARLDADVLLLCAERIRDTLVRELDLASDKPTRITLVLYLAHTTDDLVGVTVARTPEEWEYRVDVPDQIEPGKLVRGIVHPVLLELANRGQGPKSAELPLWLVEGMTAQLMAVGGPDLVMSAVQVGSMLRIVRERRGLDYLNGAREVLRATGPPSFSDLAYAKPEALVGDKLKAYQAAAHLFVYELLQSPHGPAHLVTMLRALPQCWNWEVALLRGFASEFHRMLDVEKKWAVDVLAFTAKDASRVWSRVIVLNRLNEVLEVPAEVRMTADRLPRRETVRLQDVLSTWAPPARTAVVQQKLTQLQGLRFNAPVDLIPLIDSYYRVLATYLQKREQSTRAPETRMQPVPNLVLATQDAIKELEVLDKRRQALAPEKVLSVNSPISR